MRVRSAVEIVYFLPFFAFLIVWYTLVLGIGPVAGLWS